ncbi:MAG TPA: hypothetical protein VLF94_07455 [Chlamydiales bacterium]|nr:hypothetical protein [Chlamydiales bacterium]
MKKVISLLLVVACLWSQEEVHKSPEQIAQELQAAEDQFNKAKKMINPYYQGPLLTPGAGMTAPGTGGVQTYVFVNDNYAAFNKDRHSVGFTSSQVNFNPAVYISTGITKTMDGVVVIQGDENWQFGRSGGGFADMFASVGWPIYVQSVYVPAFKFNVGVVFPTGKYQHLDKHLLNSTGGGCYQVQFSLGTEKLILWTTQHPVNLRWFFGYTVPTNVHVSGYNSYGGGKGTKGVVRLGNIFATDLGIEISLTKRWVFCTDFVYKATNRTTFHGTTTNPVGGGFSDNLSIAPGFEYTWSPNLGFLAGAWFSVYGRNSANFASAILSLSYAFP